MAKRKTGGRGATAGAGGTGPQSGAEILAALNDATRSMQAAATQISRLADALLRSEPSAAAGPAPTVQIWGDDPLGEETPTPNPRPGQPVAVPLKGLSNQLLRIAIAGPQPAIARHPPGTSEFRYWVAAEALARGIDFWSKVLPQETTWSAANPLPVELVGPGDVLNAYYSRTGLSFFRGTVGTTQVYTAESADVVCHELGHAILDAVRPQLFNAGLHEVAAFHEAFGDVSALLCALQLDGMRDAVLATTGGRIGASSRLSRVAESLGWAIRQTRPNDVEVDCLRNAANSFAYRRPDLLQTKAPAAVLSRESHSLSRVFTGAFFEALAGMFATGPQDSDGLRQVSEDAGRLLVDAVRAAPIATSYFSQVAAAMIQADRSQGDRYGAALSAAFMRRGIISVTSAIELAGMPMPPALGAARAAPPQATDDASDNSYALGYGETPDLPSRSITLGGIQVAVHLPAEPLHLAVAPAATGPASDEPLSSEEAGRLFLEQLIRDGRVALPSPKSTALQGVMPKVATQSQSRVTHELVDGNEEVVLRRIRFACCCASHGS